MGEFDRNLAGPAAAEWLFPSSPSPPTFFSTIFDHSSYINPMSEILSEAVTPGDTQRQGPDSAETGHHHHQFMSGEQRPGLCERIAARAGISSLKLNTENVRSSGCFVNSAVRSPYLTVSPGLSPTILLESPVFVSNSRVQPSPTTGKFPVVCDGNGSTLCLDVPETMEADVFDDIDFTLFGINPVSSSASPLLQDTTTKVSNEFKHPLQGQNPEAGPAKDEILGSKANNNSSVLDQRLIVAESGDTELSSDLRGQFGEEHDERCDRDTVSPSEDEYSWRKYGQKLVKGCEYPRSYYKCTNIGCQVTKKVERSRKGHVTAIIYKGSHNHPKPPQGDHDQASIDMPSNVVVEQSWKMNLPECKGNADATTSESVGVDCDGPSESMQAQFDPIDAPLDISNEEDTDIDSGDGEAADEPKSRKRKIEASEMIGATRAVREPRVVVQTTSDVDILDDGYRWRKYGQKVVKGNPNPRSYYKCTSVGCNVRKHIERASHDVKSVITTYEGKHNHEVPAPRNAGSAGSTARSGTEPSLIHTGLAGRYTAPSPFSSFSLSQQMELSSGSSFGMSRPGLSNLYLTGLSKLPGLPMNRSLVFNLLNVETEMEPVSLPSFNVSNGSSVYREIMNRLSLGSHM